MLVPATVIRPLHLPRSFADFADFCSTALSVHPGFEQKLAKFAKPERSPFP
jgi:hypothetical protein